MPKGFSKELIVVILAAIIGFSPIFSADFMHYDDPEYVISNPYIKKFNAQNLQEIFSGKATILYVPLTICSYFIDEVIGGEKAGTFHIINLIIHLLNCVLLYNLLQHFNLKRALNFIILVFFTVNPVLTESVCWITERKDVLYVFFLFLSAIFYLKAQNSNSSVSYFLSIFLFLLSCLSKPMAITFPVILGIYYWANKSLDKVKILKIIPFFLISILFGCIAFISIKNNSTGKINIDGYNVFQKSFLFISEIGYYFTKELIPVKLSLFHLFPKKSELFSVNLIALFLLGLVILFLMYRYKTNKIHLGILVAWIAMLLPVLQIIPNTHSYVSERYFYLTLIFPVIFLLLQIEAKITPIGLQYLGYGLLIIFTGMTYSQSKKWKNSEVMFKHEIEMDKNNHMALNNLGYYYNGISKYNIAIPYLKQALTLDSTNAYYLNNYAWALSATGKNDDAVGYFRKAIGTKNNFFQAHNNLGICYYSMGEKAEAFKEFKEAEKINKGHPEILYNLGAYYLQEKDLTKAKEYLSLSAERGHKKARELLVKRAL